jgi:hypothetical protein
LWTQEGAADRQTLEQVWFAGVHTEIGGRSRDASLSDISLLWMVEKAMGAGLAFTSDLRVGADGRGGVIAPNYAGAIVDSRQGFWDTLRPYHRLTESSVAAVPAQSIASIAVRRLRERVYGYSPPGLASYPSDSDPTPVIEQAPVADTVVEWTTP